MSYDYANGYQQGILEDCDLKFGDLRHRAWYSIKYYILFIKYCKWQIEICYMQCPRLNRSLRAACVCVIDSIACADVFACANS